MTELVLCYFAEIRRIHAPLNCLFAFDDAITASANTLSALRPAPAAFRTAAGLTMHDDGVIEAIDVCLIGFQFYTLHS